MLEDAGVTVFEQPAPAREERRAQERARASRPSRWRTARSSPRASSPTARYEGDLMAQAGVTYTWGREGAAQYGESLAGVRDRDPAASVPGRRPAQRRRRQAAARDLRREAASRAGSADKKVQAYNFRMMLSRRSRRTRSRFPKPARLRCRTLRAASPACSTRDAKARAARRRSATC